MMFALSAVLCVVKLPGSVISNIGHGFGLYSVNNLRSSAYFLGYITRFA